MTKNIVGKIVFESFERKVTSTLFTESNEIEKMAQAAEVVETMPFVTMPFHKNGLLRTGESIAHFLHIYKPNLHAQDYAHEIGKLHTMTVGTSVERALASAEYKLSQSQSLTKLLKNRGKSELDFVDGVKQTTLIESAYCARLSGVAMDKLVSDKIDRALMRRALRDESLLRGTLQASGVDVNDPLALIQIADDIDLTDALRVFIADDPYFNRRESLINGFGAMRSEESVQLRSMHTDAFKMELLDRMFKKHPDLFSKYLADKDIQTNMTRKGRR